MQDEIEALIQENVGDLPNFRMGGTTTGIPRPMPPNTQDSTTTGSRSTHRAKKVLKQNAGLDM